MFPGTTVEDELMLIFKMLGTPTESEWPDILDNEDFKALRLPLFEPQPLISQASRLNVDGLELLTRFLCVSGHDRNPDGRKRVRRMKAVRD